MFSIPSRASDDGFRAFIPSSIRPRKVNTTKRKQKNKAAENKLGDKGPSVNCTENKVADILQQKITLLPAPVSIATAGATVTLNDQVPVEKYILKLLTSDTAIDVPSPGSFDGAATGKPSEPGEQLPSSPDILIHDAKDLDCGSQLNRNHGPLEACTASDTAELTAASTADAHLPGSGFDCDREPKGSPETSAFGVCSPAENVSESAVRQERLHSIDGSDSHSEAADQRVAFKLTDTRDEGGRSNLDLNQIMRELGELGGDERHRFRVEITEHQEWNGEKRYGFKKQGCPKDETRWDGESYFDKCPEVIEEYWDRVRSQHSTINATEGEVCRSPLSSRILCEIKLANDSEEEPTALSEDEEDEKDEY
ncbi:hypothetical protein J4E82_009849 [Alternaria postmessia]|uniref:uncharacterized protein n=1 Tax=Alternaria postmessia TaxID=1187938 RepID=UPI002224313B|nr:uncharacterized protein J4E82_009849 [Alternaria postmessia]KAI5371441.1 hypothetical protein J4E82_009849 [Alternaria postmessia]